MCESCPYKVRIQNQSGGSQIFFGVSFFVCHRLPTIESKHKNKGTNFVKRLILVSVNLMLYPGSTLLVPPTPSTILIPKGGN